MEITVGVLLEESDALDRANGGSDRIDEAGHVPAAGRRGQHRIIDGSRVAEIGEDILRAAAEAVGREVALVVAGVVSGIERQPTAGRPGTGSFDIGDMELKFGVKATLGSGQVISALLTASGEATVEVTLKLQQRTSAETG
jgi:hypothetical protein